MTLSCSILDLNLKKISRSYFEFFFLKTVAGKKFYSGLLTPPSSSCSHTAATCVVGTISAISLMYFRNLVLNFLILRWSHRQYLNKFFPLLFLFFENSSGKKILLECGRLRRRFPRCPYVCSGTSGRLTVLV